MSVWLMAVVELSSGVGLYSGPARKAWLMAVVEFSGLDRKGLLRDAPLGERISPLGEIGASGRISPLDERELPPSAIPNN